MAENDIIAGLDLGTTKVTAIVAEQTSEGLDVIGVGSVPAKGLKRGVVVNIESTVHAIRAAIEQAETMAGVEINTVFASIGGNHVMGSNAEGVAAIQTREVTGDDVTRVLEQARAVPMSGDRQIMHVLPQEYIVDDQYGIREPVGMSGVRLEARVHMVTATKTHVSNLTRCAERCDLYVPEVVLQPLASAEAVLSEDEKEIGVALVDIGGGTSDVIIYVDGAVVHTTVIPIGGTNLSSDIATGLRTPVAEAERLKIKYGCSSVAMVDPEETIEVPSVGGRAPRQVPRTVLCEIIEPRMEEIFSAVRHVILESGYAEMLASGVVITGGTTRLEGIAEHAEQFFDMQVRRGTPVGIGGLVDVVKSPAYATGVGLVKYGAQRLDAGVWEEEIEDEIPLPHQTDAGRGIGSRIGAWFREVF